jgi:hypothetical protein
MKPQLPPEIEAILPDEILRLISRFVPHFKKEKKSPSLPCSVSPNMERDLRRIQNMSLRGKNNMFLKDLDDFVL